MYVIITCKYEKDRIKNSREKVATQLRKNGNTIFRSYPYLLPRKPAVRSGQISNSSKLSCMSSLPASMKWIRSTTAENKWQHHFTHYKSMGIFSDAQGQLTLQSLVRSGLISNSSKMLRMFLLPASMKKIRSKMKALEWSQHFPHYNPISVAMDTRVPIRSGPKPNAAFPPPQ